MTSAMPGRAFLRYSQVNLGKYANNLLGVPGVFCFVQTQLYTILEIGRAFDHIFKDHLDGQ